MTIVLQLKSNHAGVRYRLSLMFEITSLGAVLPSYDVETRVLNRRMMDATERFAAIALGLVCFFCLLEAVELARSSLAEYVTDMWNVMDWANFIVYFMLKSITSLSREL